MQKTIITSLTVVLGISLLSACGGLRTGAPTAVPSAVPTSTVTLVLTDTPTPNPCEPENIFSEVKKVDDLMNEFDDDEQLASVLTVDQLPTFIPPLQEVRRRSQDQAIPSCLYTLKSLQLQYMNLYIDTFLVFLQSQGKNTTLINQGVNQAQALRQQYNQELARLIGATYIPSAVPGTPSVTPTRTP